MKNLENFLKESFVEEVGVRASDTAYNSALLLDNNGVKTFIPYVEISLRTKTGKMNKPKKHWCHYLSNESVNELIESNTVPYVVNPQKADLRIEGNMVILSGNGNTAKGGWSFNESESEYAEVRFSVYSLEMKPANL